MIDPLSLTTVLIEPLFNDNPLAFASGIIINTSNRYFLVTNWHVASGRDSITNKPLDKNNALPNYLKIWIQPKSAKNYSSIPIEIPLYGNDIGNPDPINKLWIEHQLGKQIDVILLPLDKININIHTFNWDLANVSLTLHPSIPVSIIGFPFGHTSFEKLPFWVTGFLASEWTLKEPKVFINAPARQGLSGAPVISRQFGNLPDTSGNLIMNGKPRDMFIGIYSGRLNKESDVGTVWKPVVIKQILDIFNLIYLFLSLLK